MHIALINPPVIKLWRSDENSAHLGIAYIESYLEMNGFDVDIFDAPVYNHGLNDLFEETE